MVPTQTVHVIETNLIDFSHECFVGRTPACVRSAAPIHVMPTGGYSRRQDVCSAAMHAPSAACTYVQVPNFLLAAPTLITAAAAVVAYVRRDPARALTLGRLGPGCLQARASLLLERLLPSLAAQDSTDDASRSHVRKPLPTLSSGFYSDGVFVFVVQLAAMLLIAALFMHIQVCVLMMGVCVMWLDEARVGSGAC